MLAYGLNFYYLTYRSTPNNRKPERVNPSHWPTVTIQLPIYNERYVARRLIEAVCQLDYPHDNFEVQVLDDSTDDTQQICTEAVSQFKEKGINISYIHRDSRVGFKAGALQEGLKTASGEFIAIFDADFVPAANFLYAALPYFSSENIGLVQTRWGHLNEDYSTLTMAQALSLDAHFLIEQRAKSFSELFMNFNGTAGIWRKECIVDSGGWEYTLAEDLDLSFRAQLKGWKFSFLSEHLSPAEIPVQINASRRQQFRWAKGAAQCVRKFYRSILLGKLSLNTKLQAFFQLTRHVVFPLSIFQLILLPFLIWWGYDLSPTTGILTQMTLGPLAYVYALRKMYGNMWRSRIPRYFMLLLFGGGISLTNSIAYVEGLVYKSGVFERTPKYGITAHSETWKGKRYQSAFSWITAGEVSLAAYGILVIFAALIKREFLLLPNLAIQTLGFLYLSWLTIEDAISRSWGA